VGKRSASRLVTSHRNRQATPASKGREGKRSASRLCDAASEPAGKSMPQVAEFLGIPFGVEREAA